MSYSFSAVWTRLVARDFSSFSDWLPAPRPRTGKFKPGPESLPRGWRIRNSGKHRTGALPTQGTVQLAESPPKCRPNPPTKNRTRKPKRCSKWRSAKSALRVGPFFRGTFPAPFRDRFSPFQAYKNRKIRLFHTARPKSQSVDRGRASSGSKITLSMQKCPSNDATEARTHNFAAASAGLFLAV